MCTPSRTQSSLGLRPIRICAFGSPVSMHMGCKVLASTSKIHGLTGDSLLEHERTEPHAVNKAC